MSKRRLVITAVLAGTSQSEVARTYGVSQGWISRLMARYRVEGQSAFEPRSRAPKTHPRATADAVVELVLQLRKQLTEAGLDAGADTIGWHLTHHHRLTLSRATINRILIRHGAATPDPSKRPRSSYIRFEAEQPNETWQSDFTHYRLSHPDGTPGADVEIIKLARRPLPLRTAHLGPRQGDCSGRPRNLPQSRRSARHTSINAHRQRHGLHHPVRRRTRRQEPPRARATRPQRPAEEQQTQPPHHLRQGRTLPTDLKKWLRAQPN